MNDKFLELKDLFASILKEAYGEAVKWLANDDNSVSSRKIVENTYYALCKCNNACPLNENNKKLFELWELCAYHINAWNADTLAGWVDDGNALVEEITGCLACEIYND